MAKTQQKPPPERKKFLGVMKALYQKPQQTLNDFAAELKTLTPEDRKWFANRILIEMNIECEGV